MFKAITALLLSATFLLFSAGCGNDNQPASGGQPGTEQPMPDEPRMAPEPGMPHPEQHSTD